MQAITHEPVLLSAALIASLNALIALNVFHWTVDQVGVVNVAVGAVLALFVRNQVTPVPVPAPVPPAPPVPPVK